MPKLTFSFSNQAGDIPTYEFSLTEIKDDKFTYVSEQLELCDDKVFVCFNSFKDCDYELEHQNFFITNDKIDAELYFHSLANEWNDSYQDTLDFNFFCFKNYKEAFKYCKDLKEGL